MLGEIFYWIFNMSIAAAICGAVILPIRCIKRIPRRIAVWLWVIPFVRMCLPVGITAKYGLMSLISEFTTETVTVCKFDSDHAFTMMNHAMGASSYFPVTYKTDFLKNIFSCAAVIWIIVAAALAVIFLMGYLFAIREAKSAVWFRDNIYLSDKIRIPAVYGIIRPRIVLPREYSERNIDYILMHEGVHIKRRDNLFRILAFAAACIHWFNPLVWVFLKLLYSDMELACDEAVLSECGEAQKKEYAYALLSSAEASSVFASSFGGAKLGIRLENILLFRKLSAVSFIGFAALMIAVAYFLLTNAF